MKRRVKHILPVVLAIVMLLGVAACNNGGQPGAPTAAPTVRPTTAPTVAPVGDLGGGTIISKDDTRAEKKTPEGTLVIGTIQSLQPQSPHTFQNNYPQMLLYDRIVNRDLDTGDFLPGLATKWEWLSPTALKVTFRDDVYFHDGTKLTMEDVEYSFQMLFDPTSGNQSRTNMIDVDAFEILSDTEIIFNMAFENGTVLSCFYQPSSCIINKAHVEKYGMESFWDNVNGTGPYKLDQVITGDRMIFTRNENYWGNPGGFETIIYRYYGEPAAMFIDYENGVLDVVIQASREDTQRVFDGKVPHTSLYFMPDQQMELAMYGLNPYLSDLRVRQAIAHCIDYEAAVQMSWGVLGQLPKSFFPGDFGIPWEYHEYNPELSKQLIAEAGYKPGEIVLKMNTNQAGERVRLAETLQAMFLEVGIIMEYEGGFDATRSNQNNRSGEYDLSFNGAGVDYRDPVMQIAALAPYSVHEIAKLRDPVAIELMLAGHNAPKREDRARYYAEFQQYNYDNIISIPLVVGAASVIARDYLAPIVLTSGMGPNLFDFRLAD